MILQNGYLAQVAVSVGVNVTGRVRTEDQTILNDLINSSTVISVLVF